MSVPRSVRLSAAIAQESHLVGELQLAELRRLRDGCAGVEAPGSLAIDLRVDACAGWPRLHGEVRSRLMLECRGCGCTYEWPLRLALDLRLVEREEDERALLADAEPYWVQNDQLPLWELIEDEALLAMPMLPRCETCENAAQAAPQQIAEEGPVHRDQSPVEHPFAALKRQWKSNQE